MLTLALMAMALQAQPPETVTIDPSMFKKPTPRDMATIFGDTVRAGVVAGEALIECKVGLEGKLADCLIVSESPTGADVGRAMLKIVRRFRLPATLPDGRKVDGGVVRVPMRFGRD